MYQHLPSSHPPLVLRYHLHVLWISTRLITFAFARAASPYGIVYPLQHIAFSLID